MIFNYMNYRIICSKCPLLSDPHACRSLWYSLMESTMAFSSKADQISIFLLTIWGFTALISDPLPLAVHHLHYLHYHRWHLLLLAQYFILNSRLGSYSKSFPP